MIGRDYASPGLNSKGKPFYGPYDAFALVDRFRPETGVGVVPFRELLYLPDEARYEEVSKIRPDARTASMSAAQIREELNLGRSLPAWFTRPEVAEILAETY